MLPKVDLEATRVALAAALGPNFEVHSWPQLEPYVRDTIRRQRTAIEALAVVLLVIVLLGIASTVTMSVHERQTEIGTMLALGLRRRQVLWLFVIEAWLLGLAGSFAGAMIGAAVVVWLGARGITLQVLETSVQLHPVPDLEALAIAMLAGSFGAIAAALVQARRASKLDPVEALREG